MLFFTIFVFSYLIDHAVIFAVRAILNPVFSVVDEALLTPNATFGAFNSLGTLRSQNFPAHTNY